MVKAYYKGKQVKISSLFPNKYRVSYVIKTPTGEKKESVYFIKRKDIVPWRKRRVNTMGKSIGKFKVYKLKGGKY